MRGMSPRRTPTTNLAALVLAAGSLVLVTACRSPETAESSRPIVMSGDLTVHRDRREVVVQAWVATNEGWLEQAVCAPDTRGHESLLVVRVPASRVHAALLLAGLEPGHPGAWRMVERTPDPAIVERVPPAGAPLAIFVRHGGVERPLTAWMIPAEGRAASPEHPWVFAGSVIRPNTRSMGPGEHYVADYTGSVVGIVTFGDEVVAFDEVLSDQAEVDSPQWLANTDAMPPSGTEVELVIRPREQPGPRIAP
jgi:hypothetical protein